MRKHAEDNAKFDLVGWIRNKIKNNKTMTRTFCPFVCLNDADEMEEYIRLGTANEPLNIQRIFIGYPITEDGEQKEFFHNDDKPITTMRELLTEINAIVSREVEQGNNYAPHCIEDYCIESLKVTDGVCSVDIGS